MKITASHGAFSIPSLAMKYFLTLAAFLFFVSSAHAQRKQRPQPPSPLTVPIVYCELVGNASSYSAWELALDYGQEAPALVQDADLAEANVYVGKLTSFAAALNYLYSRGWEVENSSVMPRDLDKSGTISNRVRYLLRRRTP
jgi:hypothetical protein